MTPRDLSGQILGARYRIGAVLGAGGMGAVYEAVQIDLGRRVAIKVVHDELAWRPDIVARFEREARAAAALGHPNIVQVTDFSPGPPPFLVMELLEGASLQKTVSRGGPLSTPRVVFIATQLLSALSAAHKAGLVHRDVKPDNVFLTSNAAASDLVKVLDFGVAKQFGDPSQHQITATGEMVGSPAFMAPEQLRGRQVDARTDVYAAGVCMYYALTARLPFHATTLPQLLFAIDEGTPPPLGALRPDVDPALAYVIGRAMAKQPEQRFQSADEMLAALPRASGAPAVTPMPMVPMVIGPTVPAPTARSGVPGWMIALIAVGAALGVLLAVLTYVKYQLQPAAVAAADAAPPAESEAGAAAPGLVVPPATASAAPTHAPPSPHKDADGGAKPDAPPPSYAGTTVSTYEWGPYTPGQIHAAVTPHIVAIAGCVDKTPISDFNYGTEISTLADIFVITVGARGEVQSIGHPTDSYSRTLDACVQPILRATAWGAPTAAGTFKINVVSRRKTPAKK